LGLTVGTAPLFEERRFFLIRLTHFLRNQTRGHHFALQPVLTELPVNAIPRSRSLKTSTNLSLLHSLFNSSGIASSQLVIEPRLRTFPLLP